MLTATRAFEAETISDTLAAILTRDPDWSRLPPTAPAHLVRLMRECITRDSRLRLRDIGDARRTLDAPELQAATLPRAAAPQPWPWAVAAALSLALVATTVMWAPWKTAPPAPPMQRHSVELGAEASLATDVGLAATLSPDGQTLVFAAYPTGARATQLYARRLDQLQATTFQGTEDARAPFFSPDGQWIAFFAEGKLKKVAVTGERLSPWPTLPADAAARGPARAASSSCRKWAAARTSFACQRREADLKTSWSQTPGRASGGRRFCRASRP